MRLAEVATLSLSQEHLDILAEMNAYNLEGRYPDVLTPSPLFQEAQTVYHSAGEVFQWLLGQS